MRCLVTGGTGFIGSNIVKALMAEGHELVITGYSNELHIPDFTGRFLQPSFIGLDWEAIGKVDVCFHEAANNDTTLLDRREMFRQNVDSSKELFRRLIASGCRRIVYASSTAVYGNGQVPYRESQQPQPLNPYAESKLAVEREAARLARQHPDVALVGLRYCNVYGPGEGYKGKRATMIYQLAQQMQRGNPRIFKWGEQRRDYLYVMDAVAANLLAAKATESCIVNCGSGVATSFNDIIAILNKALGLDRKPEYFDNPHVGRYQDHTLCDMSLAKRTLGFVPRFGISEGIRDYVATGELVPAR